MKANINQIGNLSSYPELNLTLVYTNPKYWDYEEDED